MTMDVDLLPDAVVRLDSDLRVRAANAAAEELTGYDRGSMVGRRVDELLDPRGLDGGRLYKDGWPRSAHLRSVMRLPEHEVRLRTATGDDVRVSVTGRYERTPDGRLMGVVLVVRDAARRAHLVASGIEVVSTVSHELRSPLTSVKGYTSLLLNRWDRLSDDQKRMMLEQVHHDADRVTRLVTELLDISRLETGRLTLRRQMVDLPAVVERVIEKVRLEESAIHAEVSFPTDFPTVYADPDKIEQVLTNLVENAAKYADPTALKVVGDQGNGEVSVAVVDKGDGIPAADLSRIFTKFFRRAATRPTGSGLGLYISRGLVEAHGGLLVAESVEGEGSTFRFSLPVGAFEELHGP
jgi:PAS domain S-box-containing protein